MTDKDFHSPQTTKSVSPLSETTHKSPEAGLHRGASAVAKGCLTEEELRLTAQARMQNDWAEMKMRLNRNLLF